VIDAFIWFGFIGGVILAVALPFFFMGRLEGKRLNTLWQHIARQLPPDGPQSRETTFLSVPVRFGTFTQSNRFDLHAFRLNLDIGDKGIRLRQEQSLWGMSATALPPVFLPWDLISKATNRSHEKGITEETGLFFEVSHACDEAGAPFVLQVYSDSAVIGMLLNEAAAFIPVEQA